jgi:hypothetical protein
MSDSSINVMVEAKKEYTAQLCNIMCPFMIEAFSGIFEEAVTKSKGKQVLKQYQELLREIRKPDNYFISEQSTRINNSYTWFSDLLAAVFVSNVKILSSVRLGNQSKKISLKLPTNNKFIHTVYISAAADLYPNPYVFTESNSPHERDELLTKRFVNVIVNTIQNMIPVQEILKTYISQDPSSSEDVDVNMGDPEDEDPEVEEEEEPSEEAPPTEAPTTEAPAEAPEEAKDIALKGVSAEDDDVLFRDAPETKPRV